MPEIKPKEIQKQLESGKIWPVYWLYGEESLKARELLKRIRVALFDSEQINSLREDKLDAASSSTAQVFDSAQSLSMMGGCRLIVIQDAHLLKETEKLEPLLGPAVKKDQLTSCCVFLSKDLDKRKKFSKKLIQKAAVIECEAVPESDRIAWIQFLLKRKELALNPESIQKLSLLDPWSLDLMNQELDKYAISKDKEVLLGSSSGKLGGTDAFLDAFFMKNQKKSLMILTEFANDPSQSLPLLGLLAWQTRQLATLIADQNNHTKTVKLNPYVAKRLQGYAQNWTLNEMKRLQESLSALDFGTKQSFSKPLALWTALVNQNCH